jgi:adenylate kinase family enzyme
MAVTSRMRRIVVVGCSGAGKTELARELARRLTIPHVELDAFFNLSGWREAPRRDMRAQIDAETAAPRWVVDGNYLWLQDLTWGRADTVVVLDLPRRTVMRQIVVRTLRRVTSRTPLWNGNRETVADLMSLDPKRSIIRWAWMRYPHYRDLYRAMIGDPRWAELSFVRLRSSREVRNFLATVRTESPTRPQSSNAIG